MGGVSPLSGLEPVLFRQRVHRLTVYTLFEDTSIGLAKDGKSNNFVVFKPQKTAIRVEPKIQKTDSMGTTLEAAGLDVMDYDNGLGRYRVRLRSGDVETHVEVLRQLFESAYQESGGGKA